MKMPKKKTISKPWQKFAFRLEFFTRNYLWASPLTKRDFICSRNAALIPKKHHFLHLVGLELKYIFQYATNDPTRHVQSFCRFSCALLRIKLNSRFHLQNHFPGNWRSFWCICDYAVMRIEVFFKHFTSNFSKFSRIYSKISSYMFNEFKFL